MENGTKVWVIRTPYNSLRMYFAENEARDELRRKDELFSFAVSELKLIEGQN